MTSKLFAYPAFLLIRTYKYFISPFLPPSCRFYPSCSCYAEDALRKYGFIK
ncbi:MAG: membrane protein insertion efficiency factor YidD, partial [Candidatus Dadabacteria bacterium]